jgi:PST family polysaccharide transporter
MFALGMVGRSLKVALVLAPVVMCGYLTGLHYWASMGMHNGPEGVALGYSAIMILWVIPHIAWCVKDTGVSLRDILVTVSRPLLSGFVGAILAFTVHHFCVPIMPALPRVVIAGVVLLAVYIGMLFYVMGQKALYIDVLKGFRKSKPLEENALAPA